jgi:hypothetical protein
MMIDASTFLAVSVSMLFSLLLLQTCDASIKVIDLEKVYQSRPDKYLGLQMRKGVEYPAMLQRIPQNQHLCEDGKQWNVTVPEMGHPGE